MKKFLLSFVLFSIMALCSYSQSLSLSNYSGTLAPNVTLTQVGTPDSVEMVTYLNVTNTSANSIRVLCKKVQLSMLDSTETTMCWAGGCYGSGTSVSPYDQPLSAGQMNNEFSGHYSQVAYSHFKPGESVIRWVFYDKANPNDSASVTVVYTTYPLGLSESNPHKATLSSIYPNPAASDASCSYSIPAGAHGSLVVRTLLGTIVQQQTLITSAGNLVINTLNLSNGIYFCSLLVDGKAVETKKMIVKH